MSVQETKHSDITKAKRGDIIDGASQHYNGGKRFAGSITRVRGSVVFFTARNGRSHQARDISQFDSFEFISYS